MIPRREFLRLSLYALALTGAPVSAFRPAAASSLAFDYETLRQKAVALRDQPYRKRPKPAAETVREIDFSTVQKIEFRPEFALWRGGTHDYPVRFFHLHTFAPSPVKIHVVKSGRADEVAYNAAMFDYADTGLEDSLPPDLGLAGFRVMEGQGAETDWLAFQGASYFRTAGADAQYGLSARGIALKTALESREEFPDFTEFWLEDRTETHGTVRIYALMEGPSVTGAYVFDIARNDGVIMDIEAEIFTRRDIERLGLAPLTSMYWFGENSRRQAHDWRPEVHDSDGLALWTGSGERIFRPLVNPPDVSVSTFMDDTPRGFGLVQRDRSFHNYQDDGAFYEKRPSVWVEPIDDWGKGEVQLVEIPTDDEIYDNIVAYWRPADPVEAGQDLRFRYRLHWQDRMPFQPEEVSTVVATRLGRAGVPGHERPPFAGNRKFVIDFDGGPLADMAPRYDIEPVVTPSRGEVSNGYVIKIVGTRQWRAFFDLAFEGEEAIDLRCFLRLNDRTLTETWLYKFFPAAA